MKHLTITLIILALTATACKKEKQDGQKCVWNVILNNQVAYEWLGKPTDFQVKLITDSCSCAIKVNEVCFSCNTTVTTASGIDVQCK
jgi:hypothetical protein